MKRMNELTSLEFGAFPSLKRRGGCGINRKSQSHRSAADGREARARQREALRVVSSANTNFAELTTPAAPFRNGSIPLMARPPLLFKEGNMARFQFVHTYDRALFLERGREDA